MPAPVVPGHESSRWVTDRFGAVKLPWRGDANDGSPRGEFFVGHVPRCVRLLGLALVEPSALLCRCEFEAVHLHHRAEVGCCLPQGGTLVSAPQAEVDHDVDAEFESSQPNLDEPWKGSRARRGPSPTRPS